MMMTACGSRRETTTMPVVATDNLGSRYAGMVERYGEWNELSTNVKVSIESPMRLSISGKAYMVKDSLIHVSLRLLGMELGVCHVTRDTVYCLDKLHKVAVVEPMSKITDQSGITIGTLQSILLGRVVEENGRSSKGSMTLDWIDKSADLWKVIEQYSSPLKYTCTFNVGADDNVSSLVVAVPGHQELGCKYAGWSRSATGPVPETISTDMSVGQKSLKASLKYTPSSVSVSNVKIPTFKTPGKDYRRVAVNDLLKSVSTLL
ncbi:MAG: DUF4292 domain-containing protein [Muribaculaceae bacterium]|nr:DUF4292 domain-containing protein [Muribaculaceae bacterium]